MEILLEVGLLKKNTYLHLLNLHYKLKLMVC